MDKIGSPVVAGILCLELLGCATKTAPIKTAALKLPATPPTLHCQSTDGLPDHLCTPGAVRTTDVQSICHGGSTKQYRPPSSYTDKLKVQQIAEYGYQDTSTKDYEEDHLISLEIGGDGLDPKNLWPEAHAGEYGSFTKTRLRTGFTSKSVQAP